MASPCSTAVKPRTLQKPFTVSTGLYFCSYIQMDVEGKMRSKGKPKHVVKWRYTVSPRVYMDSGLHRNNENLL